MKPSQILEAAVKEVEGDDNTSTPAMPVIAKEKLDKFVLFPKFNAELRLKIWSFAIADVEPRIVQVTFSLSNGTSLPR